MRISSTQNISFHGTIKVTTRNDNSSEAETKYYKTTKRQDSEILRSLINVFKTAQNNGKLFGKDTLDFHKTIEKITNQNIKQSHLSCDKHLFVGGSNDEYDTTYNKIFYSDAFWTSPSSKITVDLMEPQDRLDAAEKLLGEIQKKISETANTPMDARLNPEVLKKTELPPERYSEIEDRLSETLRILNENSRDIDYLRYSEKFDTQQEAYEKFVKDVLLACGIKTPIKNAKQKEIKPEFLFSDLDNVRRAIHNLNVHMMNRN